MAAITSKVEVCNMALGHLGNRNTISNIDTPKNDKEVVMALWYDITRQTLLKKLLPSFALDRRVVSQKTAPAFGYAYAYEYPKDCLKLLGIGDVDTKGDVKYTVEGNLILTDDSYPSGLPIRIVKDVTDVTQMSPDFVMSLSVELAERTALSITQDYGKKKALQGQRPTEEANTSSANAQENPPIRRSVSRFHASRSTYVSPNPSKK